MKTVLTIAGSDPTGGAGIQADLKVFEAFGVLGLSVVTAVTAQDLKGVNASMNVPPQILKKQVITLSDAFKIDAVKIGMLGSAGNVKAVAGLIRSKGLNKVVLDPVFRSTGGFPLLDEKGVKEIKKLLPLATVVTPNLSEAEALSGKAIKDIKDMEEAALNIRALGPSYVLVKGGHLKGAPVDVLYDGKRFYRFKGSRIKGRKERFHGTGCVLSAGIAAGLAKGKPVKEAITDAKSYLNKVLRKRS